jgi:pyroglutamyl-peptidase
VTTVLLTGFEPFGGDRANPSGDAVHVVEAQWSRPETLVAAVMPVSFADASAHIAALIAEHSPDVVIATGLAGGRAEISVERVAVNLVDARIPDNDGLQPIDAASVAGAPAAHFATLPVKAIVRRMGDAGIPAELSHSAGTFVCNHVFFTALEVAASETRVGFLHVPWSVEDAPSAGVPALPLRQIVRAMEIAVQTSIDIGSDARVVGGALH